MPRHRVRTSMIGHLKTFAAIGLASVAVAACTFGNTDLDPIAYPGTEIDVEQGWSERAKHGVTVRATARWSGEDDVLQHLTPLHLRIENRSGRALLLSYGAYTARTVETSSPALPVIHYDHADATDGLSEVRSLDASGFEVFSHLEDEFPGVSTSAVRKARADEGYHNRHVRYLRRLDAELDDSVYIRALPEGVLADGGHVEGYVYFEEIQDDADALASTEDEPRVAFVIDLIDADTGDSFGTLDLAFEID